MAQLTKAQWEEKIRSWIPSWYFERGDIATARVKALAAVLEAIEGSLAGHVSATYIAEAEGDVLDLHGSERRVTRIEEELDAAYSPRVRAIVNLSNPPAIKRLVDAILIRGECEIREDFSSGLFCDRGAYLSRGEILLESVIKNAFTVVIQTQRSDAMAFTDRGDFLDRGAFAGDDAGSFDIMEAIRVAVNQARAAGCLFRIVHLRSS